MSGLAFIYNLSDAATWTSGGNWAKPRFQWTFSDADAGTTQSAWRVRIYNDSIKTTLLHDSGKTTGTATSYDANYALVLGTQYFWTLEVWDDKDEPNTTNPTATGFKVRWGQGIYEFQQGTPSGNYSFSAAATPDNTHVAFLFRGATDANGVGAESVWHTSPGGIDATVYDWVNILVRLATYEGGTQPALANMTFDYTGSSSSADHWTTSGGTWSLDSSNYRYGSRSLKCIVTDNADNPKVYPYRFVDGDDIPVFPNTDYMFSAFVRIDPLNAFGAGSSLRLRIYAGGSDSIALTTGEASQTYGEGATSDTSVAPEGWQRLVLRYKTADGEYLIRPKIEYVNGGAGAGDVFWFDATKFEPGTVASAWAPGWLSPAVVIDSYGVSIDAYSGGTFRLRHSDGVQEINVDGIIEGGGGGPQAGDLIWVSPGGVSDLVTF